MGTLNHLKEPYIKKIAIDVRMMWASGVGSYIRQLVPRIISARPKDRFYLLGSPNEMKKWKGFNLPNRVFIPLEAPIYTLREQIEMVRRTPSDTELFWSPFYNFPVLKRGKLLVTVHDVFHLAFPRFVQGFHRRAYARFMFRRLVRRADGILCVSDFTRGELLRLAGGDETKMKVAHNGVDPYWFEGRREKKKRSQSYLLFVGNVKPHKNLKSLLSAFDSIKDKIAHQLIIVGQKDGFITGDPRVIRQARRFGKRIQFTGLVDDERLRRLYASADLLVFPSLYEGFGLPPLEAMAAGCPVISSNAASLPEVCGTAALYFDPEDIGAIAHKILEVVQNDKLKNDLKRRGLKHALGFSWEKTADKTNRLIDSLLN